MKHPLLTITLFCLSFYGYSRGEDSTYQYNLPDSVKAVQVIANVTVLPHSDKKEVITGLSASGVAIFLRSTRSKKNIAFRFPINATVITSGIDVKKDGNELSFAYPWSDGDVYKLLIASASDSAMNYSLYSGYIWLAKEKKLDQPRKRRK